MSRTSHAVALPDFVLRQFDPGSDQPDHRQLYSILQRGIRESVLTAGTQLPPTRALAESLGIARNTVVHVYEQLTLEGYVQTGIGRGTYVASVAPRLIDRSPRMVPVESRRAKFSRRGERTVAEAGMGLVQWGAFVPGVPEVRMFPRDIWGRLQARVYRHATPQQMTYGMRQGDASLREALAEYLCGTRGVVCDADQIVITSGTQHSLHLVSHLLADVGDPAWVEDPGWWAVRSMFRAGGLNLKGIPIDAEGMSPTPEHLGEPPKMMFVTPSHQQPTGAVMSHGRRQQLLDYAAAHRVWIVEDDYDSEFRYGARPLPALQGLDKYGRVIYLGTFSKTLFPSLRIAYVVLPKDLVGGFTSALSELFHDGPTMQQAVLAQFMSEGHYATHIRRMRAVYSARHDVLVQCIRDNFGDDLPIIGGDAGLHMVLGLPAHVDDNAVVAKAAQAGVITRPLSMYHLSAAKAAPGLLLGYAAVPEDEIPKHFNVLAKVIKRFL